MISLEHVGFGKYHTNRMQYIVKECSPFETNSFAVSVPLDTFLTLLSDDDFQVIIKTSRMIGV